MDRMTLSPYFTDNQVVNQLRSFYSLTEMWKIDFHNILSQCEDKGDYLELKIMERTFQIDKVTGSVTEVTQ